MDTETIWRTRVAGWRASGETAAAYSARYGYATNTLRTWSSKLGRDATAVAGPRPSTTVRVAQVLRSPSTEVRRGAIVVELLDARIRIAVEAGADPDTLAAVLAALGARGAT